MENEVYNYIIKQTQSIKLIEQKKQDTNANLIKFNEMSPERHKEISSKGGIACGEAKRRRKSIRECLEAMCEGQLKDLVLSKDTKSVVEAMYGSLDINVLQAIVMSQIVKATTGDTKAFEALQNSLGEKPADKIEIQTPNEIISELETMVKGTPCKEMKS